MKKLFLTLILGAVALGACTNLDEEIYSKISKENFFTTEEQFVKYSARAYSSLQHWGTEKSLWTFVIQNTNEVCVPVNPNGGWWDDGRYNEVHVHNIPASNRLLEMAWEYWTNGVTACNDVLDMFESVERDFDAKNRVIAEVKTLRAYYYLCGIDNWGSIPYSVSKKETGYPEKKDRAFMFDFIEKEIKDNIDFLQVEPTSEYYGRITRGAADAIMAKLYLNADKWIGKEMWKEAEEVCNDIISRGHYSLAKNYKDNFKVDNETSPEQIFAIPYSTVYTTDDHHAFIIYMSTLPADLCSPLGIAAKAWDGLCAEPDFMASYDEGDTRKKDTWLYGQIYNKDGTALALYVNGKVVRVSLDENGKVIKVLEDDKEGYIPDYAEPYLIDPDMPESVYGKDARREALQGARIAKWTYQSDGRLTGGQVGMDNDFFLIRYADVVLMYVEALVRQSRASEAAEVPDFKQIRTRAGLQPFTASELTLDNLYWERAHELAIEGWQRQDMIRFDKYLEAWWAKPEKDASDLILPIPKSAVAANPNLK